MFGTYAGHFRIYKGVLVRRLPLAAWVLCPAWSPKVPQAAQLILRHSGSHTQFQCALPNFSFFWPQAMTGLATGGQGHQRLLETKRGPHALARRAATEGSARLRASGDAHENKQGITPRLCMMTRPI